MKSGGIEHLDFGVRNTLLYYKDLKTTLDLTPGSGAADGAVRRLLAAERLPLSDLYGGDDSLRSAAKRVRSISYRARRDIDKGAPGTLCLSWGLATWDNGRSTVPAAPIVLRQASIGRHPGTVEDFDLGVTGPWNLNVTLLRLLEVDFGVEVKHLALAEMVDALADSCDPEALFALVSTMAADVPGFTITPRVVLAPVPRAAMVVQRTVAEAAAVTMHDVATYPDARVLADVPGGTDTLSPDTLSPDTLSIDTLSTDTLSTDTLSTDTLSTDTLSTDTLSTDTLSTDTLSTDTLSTDTVVPLDTAVAVAGATTGDGPDAATADIVELLRGGMLNPRTLPEGSLERRTVERFGPDAIIGDITATLRSDGWPESLVEHADSGLRVRHRGELLQRWYDASGHRPRPSGWDATHFALWGLAAAPPVGNPALRSVARWGERRHHPILVAWQVVAEHRSHRHRRGPRLVRRAVPRVAAPRGLDPALWGLPVDLLVEWAAWVFRQWPGAPIEFVLPLGTKELVSAWYERARPVTELAVHSWVPFAEVDDDLGRSAHRWVKQLTGACGGGGAPLATWFESSMVVATEAVALRVGEPGVTTTPRGRRGRAPVGPAEHAV